MCDASFKIEIRTTASARKQPQHFSRGSSVKEVQDDIWLVSFMDYDLGYIDLEEKTLQPLNNPFGPRA